MKPIHLLGIALLAGAQIRADDAIVHFFTGGDGANPQGDLVVSGSTLYGMTAKGGLNNSGTIFQLNANGSGFSTPQSFSSDSNPSGSLTLSGPTLYGMTYGGGTGLGAIFKIQSDGSGFSEQYSFTGGETGGSNPLGSLVLSGSTLYGMTQFGGAGGTGTIFSIDVDGTGFTLLNSFTGGSGDGSLPFGSLTLSGSTLYGMTANGGLVNGGTVFRIDIVGTGFDLLHSFTGAAGDGANPQGSLLLSGSTLYGTTIAGGESGESGAGTVFKLETDTKAFGLMHSFAGGAIDGSLPSGSLSLVGSTLYGTTQGGGTYDRGTVFQIDLDGSLFGLAHSFAGGFGDGQNPQGSLTYANGQLYGTTSGGGPTGNGTVFSVAVPEPGVIALCIAGALFTLLRARRPGRPGAD
jgi:uncharacterized repeat protein (TIGR03803 family)